MYEIKVHKINDKAVFLSTINVLYNLNTVDSTMLTFYAIMEKDYSEKIGLRLCMKKV